MRRILSYYCLVAPHIYILVLRAHPVRGESHNQHNTTGEVATTSPHFYNEPHRSHVLCVKAELSTTSTSWSQHHIVAIANSEQHMHKAFHRSIKQHRDHASQSFLLLFARATHIYLFFTHILFVVNHNQTNATAEVATVSIYKQMIHLCNFIKCIHPISCAS